MIVYITKLCMGRFVIPAAIDLRLAALADPIRRAILKRLTPGEANVADIASPFAMSQPAVSHHLKVLERAGLILRRKDGTRRACRIVPDALAEVEDWFAALKSRIEDNYRRLDTILAIENPDS